MKLGELFVQLGVKGNTDPLNKTIKQLEEAKKKLAENKQEAQDTAKKYEQLSKYLNDLKNASSAQEKALIKKTFAEKVNIANIDKQLRKTNEQLNVNKKQGQSLSLLGNVMRGNVSGALKMAGALGVFVSSAIIAYRTVDRLINSLASANQGMINFQRQTGISFASLNKYASASASVNYNATPEQTARTMQTLAQNLYDIRMGRGDISPYQELAFVGGKPFNPMNMSVDELIENVREAIKGVDDVQATNIITRMGFTPDDLLMLRMTREEIEQINGLFLTGVEREKMNYYSLQLKKFRLEWQLLKDRALLGILPTFVKISEKLNIWVKTLSKLGQGMSAINRAFQDWQESSQGAQLAIKSLGVVLVGLLAYFHPVIAGLTALYLILEDLAYWYLGGGSLFKNMWEGLTSGMDSFFDKMKAKLESICPDWLKWLINTFNNNPTETPQNENNSFGGNILKQGLTALSSPLMLYGTTAMAIGGLAGTSNNITTNNNMTVYTSKNGKEFTSGMNDYNTVIKEILPTVR